MPRKTLAGIVERPVKLLKDGKTTKSFADLKIYVERDLNAPETANKMLTRMAKAVQYGRE